MQESAIKSLYLDEVCCVVSGRPTLLSHVQTIYQTEEIAP